MKSLSILILVFITLTFVPNTFAQAVFQRDLPEGAIAKIGKGRVDGFCVFSGRCSACMCQ